MPTERERMTAGEPYDPDDPTLVADRRRARTLTTEYDDTAPEDDARRRGLSVRVELALCWIFAPVAVLIYTVRRWFRRTFKIPL